MKLAAEPVMGTEQQNHNRAHEIRFMLPPYSEAAQGGATVSGSYFFVVSQMHMASLRIPS